MFLTTVLVVLLFSQPCSSSLDPGDFLLDTDFHGGVVHISGVEQMESSKIADDSSFMCFSSCYWKSECVIATFSEDYSCIMYKASNNGTSFIVGVDNVYRIKYIKEKTECGSVKLQYISF